VGEGVSGTQALGRSTQLTKGYRLKLTGRLLIFEVMRFLVVTLPILAVQTFFFGGMLTSSNGLTDTSPMSIGVVIAASIFSALAQVLVEPLYMIYITLNYLDLRVRKENLDLQLKTANVLATQAAAEATLEPPALAPSSEAAVQANPQPPAAIEPFTPVDSAPPAEPAAPVTPPPVVDLNTLTPAQRAGVLFNRLRSEGPSGDLLNELGVAYQQIGDTFGALDAFTRARALAPNDAAIAYNLAILQRDRRDFLAARRAMADYLRLETDPAERQKVLDSPGFKEILP
jgi:tetratricopeptide (TPR) repeat protein